MGIIKLFTTFLIVIYAMNLYGAKHVELSHKITDKQILYVRKNFGMNVFGTGGGMMDKIKMVFLSFTTSERANIEKARAYMIIQIEHLLSMYNASRIIRPYLKNYPFTVLNLEYDLSFQGDDVWDDDKDNIAFVFLCNDIIVYNIRDKCGKLVTVYEEPYEEAKAICIERGYLKEQQPLNAQTL